MVQTPVYEQLQYMVRSKLQAIEQSHSLENLAFSLSIDPEPMLWPCFVCEN